MFKPDFLDLFDSDTLGLSPPHDGSEFQLFPELNNDIGLFEQQPEGSKDISSLEKSKENPKKVIKIRMNPDQEKELVQYLSKKTTNGETPCLQLVRQIPVTVSSSNHSNQGNNVIYKGYSNNRNISRESLSTMSQFDEGPCLTKNAVAARENRLKKKQYLEGLEQSVKDLFEENKSLKEQNDTKDKAIQVLMNEVKYLRGVIANDSTLSSLLQNINNTPGVKFTSNNLHATLDIRDNTKATTSRKRNATNQSSGVGLAKKSKLNDNVTTSPKEGAVGICLHVSDGNVSFEMCAACSNKNKQGDKL